MNMHLRSRIFFSSRGSAPTRVARGLMLAIWSFALLAPLAMAAPTAATATHACRVDGLPNEVQCGEVQRPLDPAQPGGVQITVHYLVVPAMARNKQPDLVLLLAGGPGQSAIGVAPLVLPRFARLNNRRDLVFIDQRGTGQSAPLLCADERNLPIAQALDVAAQLQRLDQCRLQLAQLPYGDMRFYSTTIAMQDIEAVRQKLGAPQWNLVGASYGTRAALEYLRQFPDSVRRTVIDGVAPPDMVLPASFSTDGQVALDAVLQACEQDGPCRTQYPHLRQQWAALLQSLPRTVSINHPLTGAPEQFTLTRASLLRAMRTPLYVPAMAAALPAAIVAASQGRFDALLGLSSTLDSGKATRLALGMHFAVVCSEDVPRLGLSTDQPGADFGNSDAELYTQVCKNWPRAAVPSAFYTLPPTRSPVLLLSGGADPATPPRHGERVAKALGATNASLVQHIVVPQAGHGVSSLGCMGDLLFRFIDAKQDAAALPQDAHCAVGIPRPGAFIPVQPAKPASAVANSPKQG